MTAPDVRERRRTSGLHGGGAKLRPGVPGSSRTSVLVMIVAGLVRELTSGLPRVVHGVGAAGIGSRVILGSKSPR